MRSTLTLNVDDRHLQAAISRALVMLGPEGGRGLMRAAGSALRRSTLDKFKEEGDGDSPWAPLEESTIRGRRDVRKARGEARKRKTKSGRARAMERAANAAGAIRILDDNGTLRRSIAAQSSATEARVGTDLYYGVFHQTGTEHMPARPFLTIAERDRRALATLTDKYLQRVFP